MPKLKRKTSHVEDSAFEIYSGAEPPAGIYRGVIKQVKIKNSQTSANQYYNVLVELAQNQGNKAEYDGFPCWVMLTMTDKEANLRREKQFYRAVCGNEDPDIVFNALDADKDPGKVTKIGGKSPLGILVAVDIRMDKYNGQSRPKGDSILPIKGEVAPPEPDEDDDADLEDDEDQEIEDVTDEDDEEEDEEPDRRAELETMKTPELRKLARELGIDAKGVSKSDLIDSVIDAEADAAGEEDDDESDDESDDEEEEEGKGIVIADLAGLTVKKLRKKIVELWPDEYDEDDVDDMSKPDLLQMLVDDEMVDADPPF